LETEERQATGIPAVSARLATGVSIRRGRSGENPEIKAWTPAWAGVTPAMEKQPNRRSKTRFPDG